MYVSVHVHILSHTLCHKVGTFCTFAVYWSCQFIARASNMSLRHWQQMGGVKINEDILIDKSIHRSINSRSSALKVDNLFSQ